MDFLKSIAGKVVTGLVALLVIAAAISWFRMDQAGRDAALSSAGRIASWLGIVLFLPWATFFVIGWVYRMENNLAGGILVLGYTLAEVMALLWLFGLRGHGATAWTFFLVGALLAAVYNLFTCDWIAEKVG